ncbi:MAG: DUF1572 family protein [Bacteroidetes bacterium]|nr:DUF1572 family protein [Bacteroidota bacterium]
MNNIKKLYGSQLDALKEEISLYKNEKKLWELNGEIKNTTGNLCLHICGNLKYFLGNIIGNTGYLRDRDREFSAKGISKSELIKQIDETKAILDKMFSVLKNEDLLKIYQENKFGENSTYAFVFSRLISHLCYHLGQINYHRRITDI